jgi:RND family efflux transporter MFP subunit
MPHNRFIAKRFNHCRIGNPTRCITFVTSNVDQQNLQKLKINRVSDPAANISIRRKSGRFARYLLLIALILAGLTAYRNFRPSGEDVQVGTVGFVYPSQTFTLLNATGYVVPQTKADVASKATGRLEKLEVEEGSVVEKGQVLARLENRDLQAALNQAKANVDAARTELDKNRADLKESSLALKRAESLLKKKFISEGAYDTEVARHDRAVAAVANGKALIEAAEAAQRSAQVALEYTLIRAPFDGVILSKHADVGDMLAPFSSTSLSKGSVVSMADMSTLQVEADVSESNLLKVRLGQPCEVQLDAMPDERFRCVVHSIVPTVDRTKATVLVKTRFIDTDSRILPDMSAKVAFLSQALAPEQMSPVKAVAPTAVVRRNGVDLVFRVDGTRVRETPVEIVGKLGDFR